MMVEKQDSLDDGSDSAVHAAPPVAREDQLEFRYE